ncbi:hypothetical protein [Microvirga sp. Mcv34]|uniref:hypothetical protein n=1 Tax=Microvirga sp. Mcv34 TaxID=2926016 RepID=UPI0021C62ED3|nr:hypothetical protein [Microvirga sp. Mcv34]
MKEGVEFILRPTLWKWAGVLILCLAGSIVGVLMVQDGRGIGWFVGGSFFVGAIVALASLCPDVSLLKLDQETFTIRTLGRNKQYSWIEVGPFETKQISLVGTSVVFEIVHEGHKTWAMLSDSYRMKPEKLAGLMNTWRERAIVRLGVG